MCGFFLVLNIKNYSDNKSINYDFARKCSQNISHRGPDKSNEFISANGSFFSHHRLSIIDHSEYSSQPFISNNRKHIICFNGEVYNYKKLALELLDQNISGDTEVIAEIFLDTMGFIIWKNLMGCTHFALMTCIKMIIF